MSNVFTTDTRTGRLRFPFEDTDQIPLVMYSISFMPLFVKIHWMKQSIEYTGRSPHFDVVGDGEDAPVYSVTVDDSDEAVKAKVDRLP